MVWGAEKTAEISRKLLGCFTRTSTILIRMGERRRRAGNKHEPHACLLVSAQRAIKSIIVSHWLSLKVLPFLIVIKSFYTCTDQPWRINWISSLRESKADAEWWAVPLSRKVPGWLKKNTMMRTHFGFRRAECVLHLNVSLERKSSCSSRCCVHYIVMKCCNLHFFFGVTT